MSDYCATCAAAEWCSHYGAFDIDYDSQCEKAIEHHADYKRMEYLRAWNDYIYNFYDDLDAVAIERGGNYRKAVSLSEIHI